MLRRTVTRGRSPFQLQVLSMKRERFTDAQTGAQQHEEPDPAFATLAQSTNVAHRLDPFQRACQAADGETVRTSKFADEQIVQVLREAHETPVIAAR